MSFSLRHLSVLAYANGFTLWHYKTGIEGTEAVSANNFFDEAGDMMASGDMVVVSGPLGGRVLCILPEKTGIRTAALG